MGNVDDGVGCVHNTVITRETMINTSNSTYNSHHNYVNGNQNGNSNGISIDEMSGSGSDEIELDHSNSDDASVSEITGNNVLHLNETLKQRDLLIKQLSERLQVTLKSKEDVMEHAENMTRQIEDIKQQMRSMATSIANNNNKISMDKSMDLNVSHLTSNSQLDIDHHQLSHVQQLPNVPNVTMVDFECQTEWSDDTCSSIQSIECFRRASHHQDIGVGVDLRDLSIFMEDKSEQTLSEYMFGVEFGAQTDQYELDAHFGCKREVEKERKEKELMAEHEQQEVELMRQRMRHEKDLFECKINDLKSQIAQLMAEEKNRNGNEKDSDAQTEDEHLNMNGSISPVIPPSITINNINIPSSPTLPTSNLLNNERASISPILEQHIQSLNNWHHNHIDSQSHLLNHAHSQPPLIENILATDSDSCWHLYAAQTNSRLLHVLSDLVKTFLDTERDIQKQLEDMGLETQHNESKEDLHLLSGFPSLGEETLERLSQGEATDMCEDGPDLSPNASNLMYMTPPSTFSISQNDVSQVEDDVVLGASRRLRTAVDRILKLLSDIMAAHQEHDLNSVVKKNEELMLELNEEYTRRDKLTSQLMQSEERVKLLEKEKCSLMDLAVEYNESKQNLESMKRKIDEYECERDNWIDDSKRLEKEKSSFAQGLPQLQQNANGEELMSDNEALTSDVRQLQQERLKLLQRIHGLALESEQLRQERDEILDEKRRECEDFVAQIESNEKNLASYRRFIEEQTHEREIERDEFNKEVSKLVDKLKEKEKNESKMRLKLEELDSHINNSNEEKFVQERKLKEMKSQLKSANQEIVDLKSTIVQMEKESEKSVQVEKKLRGKIDDLSSALEMKLNEDSQHDSLRTDIIERIALKTHQLQSTLGSESEGGDSFSSECSFDDVQMLSGKLNSLNECIDRLVIQNNSLKMELEVLKKNSNPAESKKIQELIREKDKLTRNLTEYMRANEVLQEELSQKHLQLSTYKSQLEATLDPNSMRRLLEEMQNKLLAQQQKCSSMDAEINALRQQGAERKTKEIELIEENHKIKLNMQTIEKDKSYLLRLNEELKSKVSTNEVIIASLRERSGENNHDTIKQLNEEIELMKNKLQLAEQERIKVIEDNEECKSKMKLNEKYLTNQKQQIEDKHEKMKQMIEKTDSLSNKLVILESKNGDLINENEELKLKIHSTDSIMKSLQQQVEDKNGKVLHLIELVDQLRRKLKSLEDDKCNKVIEIEDLRGRSSGDAFLINSLKEQMEKELMKSTQLSEEVNSLKYKLKVLESEKECASKENSNLKSKLESLETVVNLFKKQLDEEKAKVLHLNLIIDELKRKIKELEMNRNGIQFSSSHQTFDQTKVKAKSNLNLNSISNANVNSNLSSSKSNILQLVDNNDDSVLIGSQMLWKLKRIVSQRNALIYQKKYLLHVLGGFQLTERATLAMLANMNVSIDESIHQRSPLGRFRSIVYVLIAIKRMQFIVDKWKYRNNQNNSLHFRGNYSTPLKAISNTSLNATLPSQSQTDLTLECYVDRLQSLHNILGLKRGQT